MVKENIKQFLVKNNYSVIVDIQDKRLITISFCDEIIFTLVVDIDNKQILTEEILNFPDYCFATAVYFFIHKCLKQVNFPEEYVDYTENGAKIDKEAFLDILGQNKEFHKLIEASLNKMHPFHFMRKYDALKLNFAHGYTIIESLFNG